MMKRKVLNNVPEEVIISKIYLIRGKKVMIDRDLAGLYGVETKVLKQAVKRNEKRFPEDFMFEMTGGEFLNWRSQNVTSNSEKMGLRYPPFCFTEQGVTMLSCVLKNQRAIDVNIRIIRVFSRIREMLVTQKDILLKIEQFERQININKSDIQLIFTTLKQLLVQPQIPRRRIGYKRKDEEDRYLLSHHDLTHEHPARPSGRRMPAGIFQLA